MPLSQPAAREEWHARSISLRGYKREDGLFDIEGHLTDCKSFPLEMEERGELAPGEPIHDMWMRMTVNEEMVIVACEAVTDHGPYHVCPDAAPKFSALVGLSVKSGFLKAAAERIGGVNGCTHLREMLQQMGTVAFQTLYPVRATRPAQPMTRPPALINSCYAYASDSEQVRRRWPQFYTGPQAAKTVR
jgi:hypothetical protein